MYICESAVNNLWYILAVHYDIRVIKTKKYLTGEYYLMLKNSLTIKADIFMIVENHDKEDNSKVMTTHKSY